MCLWLVMSKYDPLKKVEISPFILSAASLIFTFLDSTRFLLLGLFCAIFWLLSKTLDLDCCLSEDSSEEDVIDAPSSDWYLLYGFLMTPYLLLLSRMLILNSQAWSYGFSTSISVSQGLYSGDWSLSVFYK